MNSKSELPDEDEPLANIDCEIPETHRTASYVLQAEAGRYKLNTAAVKVSVSVASRTESSIEMEPQWVDTATKAVGIVNVLMLFKFIFPKKQRETILQPIVEDLKADYLEGIADVDTWWHKLAVIACLAGQVVIQSLQLIGVKIVTLAMGAWQYLVD